MEETLRNIKAFVFDVDGVFTDGGILADVNGELYRTFDAKDSMAVRMACMKDYRLAVSGVADAASAQVTRGGANVEEFDPVTLQSRLYDGLYAIGETLDIDGRCGGYHLHWAFASGLAAGRSAAHG